ncbi:hypothetical protein [Streptomyces sp. NPDC048191]|uniref:hypothetical protein n=1 Tax=Streptomyces sp. NPDC048191 TaxID=3155484 RepID=UPI0033CE1229
MRDGNADVGTCSFTPYFVGTAYLSDPKPVDGTAEYNCSHAPRRCTRTWTAHRGTTDSFGGPVTARGANPGKARLSPTYRNAWLTTQTVTRSATFTLRPGQAGQVRPFQVRQWARGTWQTYEDSHWGHYFWSVRDGVIHPVKEGSDGMHGDIDVTPHWMMAAEVTACRSSPVTPAGAVRR